MDRETALKIQSSPEFQELIKERKRITLPLLALILLGYFGFILMVAFDPTALGHKLSDGVSSIGIYLGLGLLVLSFAIVGIALKLLGGKVLQLENIIRAKFGR